jgi:FkbM family methyltransferase
MMSDYSINTWLDSAVQNYIRYFGVKKQPVVWEVGSRDGRDGVELAKRIYEGDPVWFWSNATVVLFEPNPMQADIIKAEYPEAEVHQLAASNAKGSAPFMVYVGDEGAVGSSSLNLRWKEDDLEGHQIIVDIDRLDNLIKDEQIDIMKIDCEGHSVEVVEGLGDKLKNVRLYHIETEKWTDSNIKMKAFMMGHGYTLVDESEQYGGMPDQVWVRG